MDKNNQSFQYSYSAREQAELKKIRDKYLSKEENKMDRLRRIDAGVTKKATAVAIVIGVLAGQIIAFLVISLRNRRKTHKSRRRAHTVTKSK